MVYRGANPNLTPLLGMNFLPTALLFPAPTSFDNSQTAVTFTSRETAQWRFGNCRRLDPDDGEWFIDAEVRDEKATKRPGGRRWFLPVPK